MFIGDSGGYFLVDHPGGLRPSSSLPVVFAFFLRNPRRQLLVQIVRQGIDVRLVHLAKLRKFAVGLFSVMKFHAVLRENVADTPQILYRQASLRQGLGCRAEDLRKVNNGVTRDRESKLSLFFASALDANDRESASIQNRRKRSDPGLVIVLRAKISEHRIGKMALHQLGAPQLPIFEENAESVQAVGVAVAAKQFAGSGRRARARIEKRDIHFTLGERTVDERQVADHGSKKTESKASFRDDQAASQAGARNDVAEAESEEGRAAQIHVRHETSLAAGRYHSGPGAILHEPKAKNEANGPNSHEN